MGFASGALFAEVGLDVAPGQYGKDGKMLAIRMIT
jgi:hypothetical protein